MRDSFATIRITIVDGNVTTTHHSTAIYTDARHVVANFVRDNGLFRNAYGDAEPLFRDGVRVGHYTITR